ncbi:hypothetical protein CW751_06910 [Brumimicrobium salinarum]|uniref:Secretion system C-terminal sorting domain-containing protein n=1 Tax=Brumimicrobium salinarum TaxID=2058658 RepID=A0A2I0R2U3_9FLAO|nr:T9SS type A sorting domain-containing protein [Brumimicrobium salinarum]PKR80894.1 hypothetical protein CW751_06910 [Brumimicrobium salinarum]
MENLKKIIFMLICFAPFLSGGQISFYNKFTSGPFDQGNGITQLPDSSYAITGTSGGFDGNSGQAYLMLIDSLGDHLWTKDYGGYGDDIGVRVIHVPNDGFFIAGYTGSTVDGNLDFMVLKTDESGELLWQKNYGGENWEILHDAQILSDGGLILVGHSEGNTTQEKDLYMVRTNAVGDTLWTKTIQTSTDDIAYAVDTLSNSQFVIGGVMGDAGVQRGMLAAYNNVDGSEVWLSFNPSGDVEILDLEVFETDIYASGFIKNTVENQDDYWLGKFDLLGVFDKYIDFSYDGDARITAITIREFEGLYMAIQSQAIDLNPFPGGEDMFTMKLNTDLFFIGSGEGFSAYNDDRINQMIVASDGGIVIVGTVGDKELEISSGTDVMVARIAPDDSFVPGANTGLDFVSVKKEMLKSLVIFPNPTNDFINLPNRVHGLEYQITALNGRLMSKGLVEAKIDLNNLRPGMYFLTIQSDQQIYSAKIIKQ